MSSAKSSCVMPELRNDTVTCFVTGHGTRYSSNPVASESDSTTVRVKVVTPLVNAVESAKTRAAAQLAIQRASVLRLEKK
jgi:hypothetical protein